jgi:NAD(P)-dependent dehydrogenase (short-subunit alcohol dehydrogenase family)
MLFKSLSYKLKSLKHRFKAAKKSFLLPECSTGLNPDQIPKSLDIQPDIQLVKPGQLLEGKTILVTGAGQNIGRSIAIECVQQGAIVFCLEKDAILAQKIEKILGEMGNIGKVLVCDITCHQQVDETLNLIKEMQVKIDILVNNVGIHLPTSIYQLDLQKWEKTYQTNLFSSIYLSHLVIQTMIEQNIKGNFIFLSSIHQEIPIGCTGYSSSKAAIGMMIEELAIELAPFGIRVNGIAPGWTGVDEDGHPYPDRRGHLHQTSIPPQYIGRAAVYLASDYYSQYTTGTVLKVDSGLSLMHRTVPIPQGGRS